MSKFLWEKVKRRAGDEFLSRMNLCHVGDPHFLALTASLNAPGGPQKPMTILEEWTDYGLALIDSWDIRACMRLVEAFKSSLPQHLHKRRPVCDYDEHGEWALFFE